MIWSFVAMRYYALILNRTYKIFVTDQAICGVRAANLLASPMYKIGSDWLSPDYYTDKRLVDKYQNSDFYSGSFLAKDKSNFLIHKNDIIRIDYHPKKWGMGQVPYSGRLILETKKDSIELILLGNQDAFAIKKRLLSLS